MASKESMDSSSNNNNNSSSYNDTEAIAAAAETTTGDDDAPTAVSRSKRLREQEAQQDDNSNGEPEGKRTRLGRAAKRANSGGDDGEEVDDMMPVTATEAPESREQGESPNNAAQGESTDSTSNPRWRAHQMAEDYIDLASNLMLYPTAQLGPYGYAAPSGNGINGSSSHYPLDTISALGYLKGSFRRPLVIETWAPYEIAVFEASLGHYGKDFHRVQKEIATKSCQEVVDFYYIWKKTSHYVRWKKQYVPPHLDVSDDELSVK